MKEDFNPQELVLEGVRLAQIQLEDMDDEECVLMVRSFTELMVDWQPEIAKLANNPIHLGLAVSSLASLFNLAFCRAYDFTDKKLTAQQAIEKAFSKEGDQ